jgi:hypothetical protein
MVWKNKDGENSEVVRNKARLVALSFCQKEGIDYILGDIFSCRLFGDD